MDIRELKQLIVLSLNISPCDIDELMTRDFLKNKSPSGIDRLVMQLEKDNHLYEKGDKLYAYKKSEFLQDSE